MLSPRFTPGHSRTPSAGRLEWPRPRWPVPAFSPAVRRSRRKRFPSSGAGASLPGRGRGPETAEADPEKSGLAYFAAEGQKARGPVGAVPRGSEPRRTTPRRGGRGPPVARRTSAVARNASPLRAPRGHRAPFVICSAQPSEDSSEPCLRTDHPRAVQRGPGNLGLGAAEI